MERRKTYSQQQLPQLMEKFLMVGAEEGIVTYRLEILPQTKINSVFWAGFFPNGLGPESPCAAAGKEDVGLPLVPLSNFFVASLIQHVSLPANATSENLTFKIGQNSNSQKQVFTDQMPIVEVLFLPKGRIEEKQTAFLRAAYDIPPTEALKFMQEIFLSNSIN